MHPILIVPGWTGSGPEHWQSLWERDLPGAFRVEQRDWERPVCGEWVAALDAAIRAAAAPPVLVAHSLGCLAVVHWAARHRHPVRAALLVAPADLEREDAPAEIRGFAPIPRRTVPFPSLVVGSRDDGYITLQRCRELAAAWGSDFQDVGAAGHINTASGLGAWPEGRRLLEELLRAG